MINGHKISDVKPEQIERQSVVIENCQECDTKIYLTQQKIDIRTIAQNQNDDAITLCWSCATEFVKKEHQKLSEIHLGGA